MFRCSCPWRQQSLTAWGVALVSRKFRCKAASLPSGCVISGCVTSGRQLNFWEPEFPYLLNGVRPALAYLLLMRVCYRRSF